MVETLTYKIEPLHPMFGAKITGVDLSRPSEIPVQLKETIMEDLHKYRMLQVKNDGKHISADAQLEISRWWGEIDSTHT